MRLGFYDYDSAVVGEDGVIYKEPLTSLPTSGAAEVGAGTHTYSSAGFTGEPTAGLSFSGISGMTDLPTEGTCTFWVSKEAFSKLLADIPASSQNFMRIDASPYLYLNKNGVASPVENINGRIKLHEPVSLNGRLSGAEFWYYGDPNGWELNSDGQVRVDITWDGGGIEVWVDKGRAMSCPWNDSASIPNFTAIVFNSAAASGGTYTWKNVLIATHKTVMPSSKAVRLIHFYGDSYTELGNYPGHDTSDRQKYSYEGVTEDGTNVTTQDGKVGAGYNQTSSNMDAGMIPVTQRQLAKHNLFTDKIQFWGHGGSGVEKTGSDTVNTTATRVTTALSGNYDTPDIAVIVCGYNDATESQATMEASWQSMIDEITTANSNIKIIVTTLPYHNHASFAPSLAEVQSYNVIVNAIGAANSEITIVDMYTRWGGANDDGDTLGYWSADNIHPSNKGQADYGRAIASAIASVV